MEKRNLMLKRAVICRAAAIAAISVSSFTAHANPLVKLTLLAKNITEGDSNFSSFVYVAGGDSVAYEVIAQLAPVGTNNSKGTINSLVAGTDGILSLKFNIYQLSSDAVQTDFTATSTLNAADGWTGVGSTGGTVTTRAPATFHDLIGITASQPSPSSFVDALSPGLVTSGTFQVDPSAPPGGVSSIVAMKWSTGGTGAFKINESAAPLTINNVSELGSGSTDPIVGYSYLTLSTYYPPPPNTPEPSALSLLALGALGLLKRRQKTPRALPS